ncbi:MAG: AbrB/MazE/SpoVT family DNA-binding domain-containing protein [Armatimonadetes bacterium]|nr:AbrB/MazE/SpoVT family DNA-binding domain-containing protein [Armatimonadota bacterium]
MAYSVVTVVTAKGQVTIPKSVRDRLGIHAADVVEFEVRQGGRSCALRSRRGLLTEAGPPSHQRRPAACLPRGAGLGRVPGPGGLRRPRRP